MISFAGQGTGCTVQTRGNHCDKGGTARLVPRVLRRWWSLARRDRSVVLDFWSRPRSPSPITVTFSGAVSSVVIHFLAALYFPLITLGVSFFVPRSSFLFIYLFKYKN